VAFGPKRFLRLGSGDDFEVRKRCRFYRRLSVCYGVAHEFTAKLDVNCMTVASSNAWNA
jgi:hypothetical protein